MGDLQFMYIATLVALTAGIVVPFSPTYLPFPGLLLVGSPLGQQPRRQQHRLLHMMGVSATMCSCLAGRLQQLLLAAYWLGSAPTHWLVVSAYHGGGICVQVETYFLNRSCDHTQISTA